MMSFAVKAVEFLWNFGNNLTGLITPKMYLAFTMRFILALEMGYCSNYIYVALAQFKFRAAKPKDVKVACKVDCYVAHPEVSGDVRYAADRGETYRHVSEFSGTTVRGSLTLPTVLTTGSVFLCLLSASVRAVGALTKTELSPPLTFFARFFGYGVLVLTGIVPCPPNKNLSSRDYSIVLGSWQALDSKWEKLHGLGVGLFCFVPLIALTVEAFVMKWTDWERWIGLGIQYVVAVLCFSFISLEYKVDATHANHEKIQWIRRHTFLFEVSTLFIALFQYTGHEVSVLSNMLGMEGYTHFTFSLVFESLLMLFGLVMFYKLSAATYNYVCAHHGGHGHSHGTTSEKPKSN